MIKLKTDYKWLFPLLLVILGGVAFAYHQLKQKPTLKIGIYVGSSWEVPNGNDYKVIDAAISRFKK